MKRSLFYIFFTACFISSFGQGSHFYPQAGAAVQYLYDPKGTKLEGEETIEAVLFVVKGLNIQATDLTVTKQGGQWRTSFLLPDSATAFALRFKAGDVIDDNNGEGYVYQVYRKKEPVKGSYAGKAMLYQSAQRPLGLSSKMRPIALELYEKEMALNPAMNERLRYHYYRALVAVKKKESHPVIEEQIRALLASGSKAPEDWKRAAQFYSLIGKRAAADSLEEKLARAFPESEYVMDHEWNRFQVLTDPDSMKAFYQDFARRYHGRKENSSNYMLLYTVYAYITAGKYDEALNCLAAVVNKETGADLYNGIAQGFIKEGKRLVMADSLATMAVNMQKRLVDQPLGQDDGPTSPAEQKQLKKEQYGKYLATLAVVKAMTGNPELALKYQQQAVTETRGRVPEINEHYISYLIRTGDSATARAAAAQFVRSGHATSRVKEALSSLHQSSGGGAAYIDSLEAIANKKQQAVLTKDLINKKVKDFDLPVLDQSSVSLASLKGKVVVVDFWATWCTPCKASFPGMQHTVDKYKNDKDVVFLFVDTWENVSGETRADMLRKFLKDHQYTFTVLLDQPLPGGNRSYQLATDFGVEGIPTKFILDRNGNIRFVSIGFKGDAQHLEMELSNMIELVKTL